MVSFNIIVEFNIYRSIFFTFGTFGNFSRRLFIEEYSRSKNGELEKSFDRLMDEEHGNPLGSPLRSSYENVGGWMIVRVRDWSGWIFHRSRRTIKRLSW